MVTLGGCGAITIYNLSDKEKRNRIQGNFQATYRVLNLVQTTISIALDYGYHMKFNNSKNDEEYRELSKKLLEIQNGKFFNRILSFNSH